MNGLNVFGFEPKKDLGKIREVLEQRLNPSWIKERKQGNTTLSYIGGHTVIRLLNDAFDYQWSFEIVSEEIVPSLPKALFSGYGKDRKPTGQFEEQPPVAKVLGRLTVPGLGVKEQYGSKVIIGGATEQEASFKSASTDALKKCATLFGIGLELYEDDSETPTGQASGAQGGQQPSYSAPAPAQQSYSKPATPASAQQAAQAAVPTQWNADDVNRLKELKAVLGVTDNNQLDPFVREFLDDAKGTYMNVTPANIKAFNIFLAKKAETV